MKNSIQSKETGRKWLESIDRAKAKLSDHQWKLGKALAGVLVASSVACSSPQERYQSWETQSQIEAVKNKQSFLIEAYNSYFDEYERLGKVLVELQSSGDIWGYQVTFEQREQLFKEIKNIEEQIDDLSEKKADLESDLVQGKAQNAADQNAIPHPSKHKRRTFIEKK